jgi:hypothetical protein
MKNRENPLTPVTPLVDISGTTLRVGDKVAVQYSQLFRIGKIVGFTPKKVLVGFDFTETHTDEDLEVARFSPWKLAKIINQDVGLQDYYQYIQK